MDTHIETQGVALTPSIGAHGREQLGKALQLFHGLSVASLRPTRRSSTNGIARRGVDRPFSSIFRQRSIVGSPIGGIRVRLARDSSRPIPIIRGHR